MALITLHKKILYVTGLPRSGSTLLCQLLAHHPDIYSTGHTSPLCQILDNIRHFSSDNEFLLSQMDVDFDLVYHRLVNAYRGFINGWFAETQKPVVVDKHRNWLRMIEMVDSLDPDFHMVVCIRDLRQIFGSIDDRHRKTVLIDFPDHMPPDSVSLRAGHLFGPEGVIGGPLHSIEEVQNAASRLKERLRFVPFETLVHDPLTTMKSIHSWCGLTEENFNPGHLTRKPCESESYYRFKYLHTTYTSIKPPEQHIIPSQVEGEIMKNFYWFYEQFYPECLR